MWAVVTSGTALIAATYGLARFGYGLFLPHFTATFAIGPAAAGVISAGSFASYCLSSVLASRMGAHPRRIVICAGGSAAVGSSGVAASPDLLVLALSVIVAGAGAGFASPGLVALVARNVVPTRQENAQTVVNSGTGAGIAAAGVLVLLTQGHWRIGWLVIATVVVTATVAVLRSDARSTARRAGPPASPPRPPARTADLARLSRPVLAAAVAGIASAAVWTFGASLMTAARSGGDSYTTIAWIVLGAFGVLGATAGTIVRTWDIRTAWMITCTTMAAATLVLGVAPASPALAYTSVAAFGASYTALSGVLIVWAVRVTPGHQAEGTIVLFIALAVGQALGSAGLGVLQGFVPQTATFALAGGIGLLALLPAMTASGEVSRHGPSGRTLRPQASRRTRRAGTGPDR